jgi:long-chain acyl-CoA synthetase
MTGQAKGPRPFQPGAHAAATPDKPCVVFSPTGATVTYRELSERSQRLAQLFRSAGLHPRDHVALLLENSDRFYEVAWAAQRAGLYYTPINPQLSLDEMQYVIQDSRARALVVSARLAEISAALVPSTPVVERRLSIGGGFDEHDDYDSAIAAFPAEPVDDEIEGAPMCYTSGTTGRPKGVLRPLRGVPVGESDPVAYLTGRVGYDENTVFLVPAPLCHSAPLGLSMAVMRHGGTVVLMDNFDASACLSLIARFGVTHGLFVPTMFVRMLRLSQAERAQYVVSSLRAVLHVGSPCPVHVKRAMIEWLGPVLYEFYAGSEANGATFITSQEWLARPGSVGRSIRGDIHIAHSSGRELDVLEPGLVWFDTDAPFEYFNDKTKTEGAYNSQGWSTLGDVGYLDDDGYLFLTGRSSFTIISGGLNIYPQEVENVLILHPAIADAAVFGIPDEEYGESVVAVLQLADSVSSDGLEREVREFCRERLAHYKCPRRFEVVDVLPRDPMGKLQKEKLRTEYLGTATSSVPDH